MNTKKKVIMLFAAIFLALNTSFIAVYFLIRSPTLAPPSGADSGSPMVAEHTETDKPSERPQDWDDEYYSTLFNYGDAIEICTMEVRSRNSNLIQLTVNEHSTRFNPAENQYLVKIDSHVGTPLLYDEKTHTCEIDPATQGIAFYREITRRQAVRPK